MELLRLRVRTEEDGGWRIEAGRPGAPRASGIVPSDHVDAVLTAAAAMPRSRVAATDWKRAERTVGHALAAALDASGSPARAWMRALGRSEGSQVPMVVVLDAPEATVRDLPWELIAVEPGQPALEAANAGVVVRWTEAAPELPPAAAPPLQVALGHVGEQDVTVPLDGAISAACRACGLGSPVGIDAALGARVVDLIVAPDGADAAGGLLLGRDPAAWPQELRALHAAELVWVPILGDGAPLEPGLADLPARIVRQGAVACLQADVSLGSGVAAEIAHEVHTAVASGTSLLVCLGRLRAVLRDRDHREPEHRWWRQRLWIGRTDALLRIARPRSWRPSGWPDPSPRAADLLKDAQQIATPHGYLGFEHLAAALAMAPPPELEQLAHAVRSRGAVWERRVDSLIPREDAAPTSPVPTPRLLRIARDLNRRFTIEDLFARLVAEQDAWGRWLGDIAVGGHEPYRVGRHRGSRVKAHGLEVLGGPEDGRRLPLSPGDVLGRHTNARMATVPMYAESLLGDPRMSRQHLQWVGPGRVLLLSRARAMRTVDGMQAGLDGEIDIHVGDVIELTPSTWLVGVGPGPSESGQGWEQGSDPEAIWRP